MTREPRLSALCLFAMLSLLASSCTNRITLDRDLRRMLAELPAMPDSDLLSEAWETGGGSDSRCDGRIVSRLYGTQRPIEDVVTYFQQEMLGREGWSDNRPIRPVRDIPYANLLHKDGYLLGVSRVENLEAARRDPSFSHRDVIINRPYATLYEIGLVHINAGYVDHCWGRW